MDTDVDAYRRADGEASQAQLTWGSSEVRAEEVIDGSFSLGVVGFSLGFLWIFYGFSMVFLWFFLDFLGFSWVFFGFSLGLFWVFNPGP